MMTIKTRTFAIIIAASLLIGAGFSGFVITMSSMRDDYINVKTSRYLALEQMYTKYGKLDTLEKFIEANYYKEVDEKDLMTGAYRGLFAGLNDMYSHYMTADEYDALNLSTSGEFQGIGITFSYNEQDNLVIVSTMDDSPALKAGLLSGDVILAIDDVAYGASEMDEAGAHMRGKPGTKVKLTILRDKETKEYVITRANIIKYSVSTEMLEGDIAYIRISAFEDNTGEEFQRELRALEVKGVKGMVIDLRNNGGGIVKEGEKIADLLLPACTIVYLVDNQGEKKPTNSDRNATQLPYVLLVNENTASTSEILAAAVKDNHGGKLVGTKTFGKGIVQSVMPLNDDSGDAIKLTTSQYLSPNGDVIHQKGIEPDYEVELKAGDARDYQLEKAIDLLK